MSGADLDTINQGTVAHLTLRDKLLDLANAHECWMDLPLKQIGDNTTQLHGLMLSLSSALLLYDNYLLAVSEFQNNKKLRRIINDSDKGYQLEEEKLSTIGLEYYSVRKRKRVKKAIQVFEEKISALSGEARLSESIAYLENILLDFFHNPLSAIY